MASQSDNSNEKNLTPLLLLAMLVGFILGIAIAPNVVSLFKKPDTTSSLEYRTQQVIHLINTQYVDKKDTDTLTDQIINSILTSLDPHSRYLSASELERQSAEIQGHFEGIGAILQIKDDTVCVNQILPESPAQKAGLRAGDRIIAVDTFVTIGKNLVLADVVKKIRGPRFSHVNLSVKRHYAKGTYKIKVIRNRITTPSINYSGMLNNSVGYIHLSSFTETSYPEFHEALLMLKKQGMKELVFDLRDNAGGLLDAAIKIVDELLPNGNVILFTEGAHQKREVVRSSAGGLFEEGKLTILINEFSASASEIVSGAVQDNDRGIIAGRRSFGKGLVQRQFDLPGNAAVWLTVARYHTPSGRCIQRPYDKGSDEYYSQFLEELVANAEADSILFKITDSTQYHTKKGRVIYGGGGIIPDHIISYKKDPSNLYYNQLNNRGIVSEYAFGYISSNITILQQKYPTLDSFIKGFSVSDNMIAEIRSDGEKKGILADDDDKASTEKLKTLLKAYIAESLYGWNGFYKLYLTIDNDLQSTLNYIKK